MTIDAMFCHAHPPSTCLTEGIDSTPVSLAGALYNGACKAQRVHLQQVHYIWSVAVFEVTGMARLHNWRTETCDAWASPE